MRDRDNSGCLANHSHEGCATLGGDIYRTHSKANYMYPVKSTLHTCFCGEMAPVMTCSVVAQAH